MINAARNGDASALRRHAVAASVADWRALMIAACDLDGLPDATHQFFERFWIGHGVGVRRTINDDRLLVAALRRLTRPYTGPALTVWRGQSRDDWEAGRLGLSWATDRDAASTFGRCHQWNRRGGVVILEAETVPITIPRTGLGPEVDALLSEAVVDPGMVDGATVVERIDRPMNAIEWALSHIAEGS